MLRQVKHSLATDKMENSAEGIESGAKISSAAMSKNLKAALFSIADNVSFCETGGKN